MLNCRQCESDALYEMEIWKAIHQRHSFIIYYELINIYQIFTNNVHCDAQFKRSIIITACLLLMVRKSRSHIAPKERKYIGRSQRTNNVSVSVITPGWLQLRWWSASWTEINQRWLLLALYSSACDWLTWLPREICLKKRARRVSSCGVVEVPRHSRSTCSIRRSSVALMRADSLRQDHCQNQRSQICSRHCHHLVAAAASTRASAAHGSGPALPDDLFSSRIGARWRQRWLTL
jgi:hypothetical protein